MTPPAPQSGDPPHVWRESVDVWPNDDTSQSFVTDWPQILTNCPLFIFRLFSFPGFHLWHYNWELFPPGAVTQRKLTNNRCYWRTYFFSAGSNGVEQYSKIQKRYTIFQQSSESWKSNYNGAAKVAIIEEQLSLSQRQNPESGGHQAQL